MKPSVLRKAAIAIGAAIMIASAPLMAQEPKSLDELLELVKDGKAEASQENRQREQRFRAAKNRQQELLQQAKADLKKEEERASTLETKFDELELEIADKKKQLQERLGVLTELFGHMTSAAGDLRSNFKNSLVSVQYPDRSEFLSNLIDKMGSAEELPKISEIERLWFEMQREMTESGKVVKFETEVTTAAGKKEEQQVMRVGLFNMVNEDGKYLQYIPENDAVAVLPRQPSGPYIDWADEAMSASEGMHPFGVDPTGPTGGSYLSALIDSPDLEERWHQGGIIGYIITAMGVFAILLAIWRLVVLSLVNNRVNAQLKSATAKEDNPLGRVLKVHEDNPNMHPETLELKLSEAVLKETPKLENSLNLLKIIAAVGPLMGLLGTVTGMIITFQAITIFGAGDPKAMAGGISGALVTTVLGLCVAIPTTLLHTVVNSRAQKIIHLLEEQTTGIIAKQSESQQGG